MKTSLDLIDDVDGFPYEHKSPDAYALATKHLWTLLWHNPDGTSYPIGYILDRVYQVLLITPESIRGPMNSDPTSRTVSLFHHLPTESQRTAQAIALANNWRRQDAFPVLRKWRDELWPVYGRDGELLFSMERSALGLLGAMRYGIHMIAYVKADDGRVKFWVPRRAADKSTFPGMLDNTVAGGLCTGEDPFECLIREADEEASLPAEVVRAGAKLTGTVTYISVTDDRQAGEVGLIYPECQWVYELELPAEVVPLPKDGEVDEFMLVGVDEVRAQLARGEYKPNCALCVIDFFVRHGISTGDSVQDLEDIARRIHRKLPFPGPHQEEVSAAAAA